MERIEISSILKAIVSMHFGNGVDWRLIDETAKCDIPGTYRRELSITREQFDEYLSAEFGCNDATIRRKWKILTAQGYLVRSDLNTKKAYINLARIKEDIPEYLKSKFNYSVYSLEERTHTAHTQRHTRSNDSYQNEYQIFKYITQTLKS